MALWASITRTIVPIIIGFVLAQATQAGIVVDADFEVLLDGGLTALFTGLYYIGARLLEVYVTPKFGWLLGLAKSPDSYSEGPAITE